MVNQSMAFFPKPLMLIAFSEQKLLRADEED
jgi:hypothetical protein